MRRAFGPYEVERELARGGMGVVYAVRHRETGVRYALKTLAGFAGGEDAERFRREAELLSRLDHPGIVKVHMTGVEGGVAFLVQSFLPGGSLQERLRERGRLPRGEATAVVIALAEAVEYAHAHGVLHRDLKPDNVLFDEQGRPALVDFGLGRDLGAESRRLTETGQVMGTPGYMAPEQVQGERRDDPRTDVYGLGALLFALLTGGPPFRGQGLGILARIVHDSAPDLSVLEPETPPALAATVARCLAKRPGDRFQSAAELARVLRSGERPAPTSGGGGAPVAGLVLAAAAVLLLFVSAGRAPRAASTPATPPRVRATASPRPTAAARAIDWRDLIARVDQDPGAVLARLEKAREAPPEVVTKKLLAAAERAVGRLRSRAERAGPRADAPQEDRARWLVCLQIHQRLRPGRDLPERFLLELERLIPMRGDSPGGPFVRDLLAVLGAQHVPQVASAVLTWIGLLPSEACRAWVPAARRLVDGYPREPAEQRVQAQLRLVELLSGVTALHPAVTEAERRDARHLLERVDALLPQVSGLRSADGRSVVRAGVKACLRLGELARADELARRGSRLRDRACRGLQAFVRLRGGDPGAATREALAFLEDQRRRAGGALYAELVGLVWDQRLLAGAEVVERELRLLIDSARQQPDALSQRTDFHGHRLRLALLLRERGRLEPARLELKRLQERVRRFRGPLFCACRAEHHRRISRLRLGADAAPLRALVDELDARRRRGLVGRP